MKQRIQEKKIRKKISLFIFYLFFSFILNAQQAKDSLCLEVVPIVLYSNYSTIFFKDELKKASFLSYWQVSSYSVKIAREFDSNSDFFKLIKFTSIQEIIGVSANNEYFLEDFYDSKGDYTGASLIFDVVDDFVISVRFINR